MKQFFTTIFFFSTMILSAQTVADFEDITLDPESYLNGMDGVTSHETGNIILPVNYNPSWMAWTGFSISNTTDVVDPSYDNQYSAITGGGVNGSSNYAVAFANAPQVIHLKPDAFGKPIKGMYITSSTLAYFSVKNGDGFAKKFGGVSGNDPDWFKIIFQAYQNGGLISSEKVEFFLADYRSSNNDEDYIVDEWTWVDLTSLGNVDSLLISMNSTDSGGFGMNTPGYFCLDDLTTEGEPNNTKNLNNEVKFSIYPNPATDYLIFDWKEAKGKLQIVDFQGKLWDYQELINGQNRIDLKALPKGFYTILVRTEEGFLSEKFVKN